MSRSKAPLFAGIFAAGGIGYYLYSAGGNPKAAEARFESDVHKASAEVKSHLPGDRTLEPQNKGARAGSKLDEVGAKFDSAVAEAEKKLAATRDTVEAYGKEAKADALKKVDAFDKKVEEEAAKAKSGIFSWFSGK